MKILHITPAYVPAYRYGGPIRVVHEMNKWLVAKGAEVTVYTTNVDGRGELEVPLGKGVMMDGVRVFYFPISFPRAWFHSKALKEALEDTVEEFDVIHITSTFLAASYFGSRIAKKAGVPYIISPRGNFMRDTFRKNYLKKKLYTELFEKFSLRNAAAIHFTAEAEKKEYEELGMPLRRAIIVPNGIDNDTFKALSPKGSFREKFGLEHRKIILFLSRISWKKGFDTLIPAMTEVVRQIPMATLLVAGPDDEGYRGEVERMIRAARVEKNVMFTGMLLGGDKTAVFQDSDVFVLPSISENFANAVVEAMYFKLPVIITEGVAIAEDVAEVGAGMVIKKNVKELVEALTLVLSNKEIASKIGKRGRELVESKFFWPKIVEHLLREYESLVKLERI